MKEPRYYEDSFAAQFEEENEFLTFLRKVGMNSDWIRKKSRQLKIVGLESESILFQNLKEEFKQKGKEEGILDDTLSNTQLVLKTGKELYPVRNCAIKTILERAGISGPALKKVGKNVYARIINDCLKVSGGESLLRMSEGKVSAVLGGGHGDYAILDMEQIFLHTVDYLNQNYKGCTFAGGYYDHTMATAMWELSGEDKMLMSYQDKLDLYGVTKEDMIPAIRVSTSDIGISGANLYPMLISGSRMVNIPLGGCLKLEHKAGASIARFDEQLKLLYGKYQVALHNLTKLLDIEISNPINCMAGVMKRIGIQKRYISEVIELYKAQYGEDICTAHQLYYGINEVLFMMISNGESGNKIANMEETVARALNTNWREFDVAGEIKW